MTHTQIYARFDLFSVCTILALRLCIDSLFVCIHMICFVFYVFFFSRFTHTFRVSAHTHTSAPPSDFSCFTSHIILKSYQSNIDLIRILINFLAAQRYSFFIIIIICVMVVSSTRKHPKRSHFMLFS